MAYKTYLLKIDGIEFNNLYMVKESYTVIAEKEILDSYKDANGSIHVSRSNNITYEISFNTPYLDEIGIAYIKNLITSKNMVNVEFFDTNSLEYISGNFIVQDKIESNIHRRNSVQRLFKPVSITLYGYTKIAE